MYCYVCKLYLKNESVEWRKLRTSETKYDLRPLNSLSGYIVQVLFSYLWSTYAELLQLYRFYILYYTVVQILQSFGLFSAGVMGRWDLWALLPILCCRELSHLDFDDFQCKQRTASSWRTASSLSTMHITVSDLKKKQSKLHLCSLKTFETNP